jgi:hypothetical protein
VFQVLASALVRTWKNRSGHPTVKEMRDEERRARTAALADRSD